MHPSFRLKWKNKADRDVYIKQLLDYRQKKRVMKPQIITLVCLVCGRGPEIETRYMDRHYYCEGCTHKVIILRQRARYQKNHKIQRPRLYPAIIDRKYFREYHRINADHINDLKRANRKKLGHNAFPKSSYTPLMHRLKHNMQCRQYDKKVRWFKPIRKRLIKKNEL